MFSPIIPEPLHLALAPPFAVAANERRRDGYETRLPNDAGILAIDLAKTGFQVCATAPNGEVLFNRKFSRPKLERFPDDRSPGPVAMEACPTARAGGASRRPQAATFA